MNKKTMISGLLIGLVIGGILTAGFGITFGGAETEKNTNAERYRLFNTTVQVHNELNNKMEPTSLLFLLDAATGDVKYYYMGLTKQETMIGKWMPSEYKVQMTPPVSLPIPVPK